MTTDRDRPRRAGIDQVGVARSDVVAFVRRDEVARRERRQIGKEAAVEARAEGDVERSALSRERDGAKQHPAGKWIAAADGRSVADTHGLGPRSAPDNVVDRGEAVGSRAAEEQRAAPAPYRSGEEPPSGDVSHARHLTPLSLLARAEFVASGDNDRLLKMPLGPGSPIRRPDRSTHMSLDWPTAPAKKTRVPESDTENSPWFVTELSPAAPSSRPTRDSRASRGFSHRTAAPGAPLLARRGGSRASHGKARERVVKEPPGGARIERGDEHPGVLGLAGRRREE